jgi:hypothetical protein
VVVRLEADDNFDLVAEIMARSYVGDDDLSVSHDTDLQIVCPKNQKKRKAASRRVTVFGLNFDLVKSAA